MISIESAIPSLNEYTKRQLPSLNAPGLAIGFTHREHILHLGVYGLANREAGHPVTLETLFQIGSISKSLTYESDQLEPGLFRVGDDPHSPEFIRFDIVIDGNAMQAILSGGAYSRKFTL